MYCELSYTSRLDQMYDKHLIYIYVSYIFSNIHIKLSGQIIYNHEYNLNDNATACAIITMITAISQVHYFFEPLKDLTEMNITVKLPYP